MFNFLFIGICLQQVRALNKCPAETDRGRTQCWRVRAIILFGGQGGHCIEARLYPV